jgi:4-amino-4-deoxy-L-arabinose transferase-like glycosyltransferase
MDHDDGDMSGKWRQLNQRLHPLPTLFVILAIGLLLRLPGIDRDLWYDETWGIYHARGADVLPRLIPNGPELTSDLFRRDGGWRESLLAIGHAEWTPPLYYLMLRVWIALFGESNRVFRVLSLIAGLFAILAVFLLGRAVWNDKVGLVAAGVLAVLPIHIQYSQEVRAYAPAIVYATLASWAFWRAYQRLGQPQEWRCWLLYLLFAALSLYTHYFTGWVLVAHGVFAVTLPTEKRWALVKRLSFVACVTAILLSPWILSPYFNNQVFLAGQLPFIPTFWTMETPKRLVALVFYLVTGFLPSVRFKSLLGLVTLTLYALIGFTLVRQIRARERNQITFSILLFLVPIVIVIAIAAYLNESGLIAVPRFVLPALGGLCLLFGVAIIYSRRRAESFLIVGVLLGLCVHFQVQWHYAHTSSSPRLGFHWAYGNVSPAVAKVAQQAQPDDLLLFDDVYLIAVWNVYDRSRLAQLLMGRMTFLQFNPPSDFEARWREVEATYAGIFLIRRAEEPPSEVMTRLETGYHLVSQDRMGRLEIRRYRKRLPGK